MRTTTMAAACSFHFASSSLACPRKGSEHVPASSSPPRLLAFTDSTNAQSRYAISAAVHSARHANAPKSPNLGKYFGSVPAAAPARYQLDIKPWHAPPRQTNLDFDMEREKRCFVYVAEPKLGRGYELV
ncbi:hypothetical protein MVEN_01086100 [Mycena venus]|uniref:Uncharacterized protein n=1 Tax=Mycena venus TaxID=2733690 RepID=A0A8H7CXB5_9AGAR|nr:hypothetical protein MVEN_01086100 [Mycena venus]